MKSLRVILTPGFVFLSDCFYGFLFLFFLSHHSSKLWTDYFGRPSKTSRILALLPILSVITLFQSTIFSHLNYYNNFLTGHLILPQGRQSDSAKICQVLSHVLSKFSLSSTPAQWKVKFFNDLKVPIFGLLFSDPIYTHSFPHSLLSNPLGISDVPPTPGIYFYHRTFAFAVFSARNALS